MLEKVDEKRHIIVPIFFFVLLLIGIIFVKDYGMPWDEKEEKDILLTNVKEYVRVLLGEDSKSYHRLHEWGVENIAHFEEIDHGESFYYGYVPFSYITRDSSRWSLITYHFYTYLIFLLGAFTLYLIIKRLSKDWKYGVLGCLFLFLSPRIFAECFYNNKDIVLMCSILFCCWFGIQFVDTCRFQSSFLFGVVSAFAANTRVMGFFIFGLFGLLYIMTRFVGKDWSKRRFVSGLIAMISFLLTFLMITPATWSDPLHYFNYVLTQSMNFVRWTGWVFYRGEVYNNAIRPLPWHYLLVIFGVTTPVLIVLLIIYGHWVAVKDALFIKFKDVFKNESKYYLLLMLFVWAPLGYAIISKPTIYNGWRHFYFVYGPLLILAVLAAKSLIGSKNRKVKNVTLFLIGIQLCSSVVVILLNHPNEYTYYNVLAGRDIELNYELDYWNVSVSECLRKLVDEEYIEDKLKVSARDFSSFEGLYRGYDILPLVYKDKIRLLDYRTQAMRAEYWIVNPTYSNIDQMVIEYNKGKGRVYNFKDLCDEVVSVKAFGSKLTIIYELKKD